ncbi:hypothetical protein AB0A87_39245, partial [Streptomyces sp. NPDC045251]
MNGAPDAASDTHGESASRTGKWLSLSSATAERHTAAVVADRFDLMTWRDMHGQSAGLRELARELDERHTHAADLLADTFLAAYKARPRLRRPAEMDPARLVNHQIITSLTDSPEFAALHRETAGDAYAAAMAVLAQAGALRRMLEHSGRAQEQAERARRSLLDAEEAAAAVADALRQAAHETHETHEDDADAVARAAEAAESAEDAARAAAAG